MTVWITQDILRYTEYILPNFNGVPFRKPVYDPKSGFMVYR
jgi:hypothetical protein